MDNISKFMSAKSFAVYYGKKSVEKLKIFDIAIIEPSAYSDSDILELKSSGTLPIAYMTTMELNSNLKLFSLLNKEDFIHIDGKPFMNTLFNNHIVDISSKRLQNLLLHQAGSFFYQHGYAGVFLDTIGNCENNEIKKHFGDKQFWAALEFIKLLRNRFPELIIIQNNGLEQLFSESSPFINGICWENPPFQESKSAIWMEQINTRILEAKSKFNTKVMLVMEDEHCSTKGENLFSSSNRLAKIYSKKYDYLLYFAPCNYIGEINQEDILHQND